MFFVGRIQGRSWWQLRGGISVLDEKSNTWGNLYIIPGTRDAFVYDVIETKTGDLWIAQWSGVNRVEAAI